MYVRILTLLTHLRVASWEAGTTRIDEIDPLWMRRSVWSEAWHLIHLADAYDSILFYNDVSLPVLFWLFYFVRHAATPPQRLVYCGFLCDVSRFNELFRLDGCWFYDRARWFYFWLFVRIQSCLVVYSRAEVQVYADSFRVASTRFKFVPFYVRTDAMNDAPLQQTVSPEPYILAAGRHRDFATFGAAMRNLSVQGIVVAGDNDRASLPANLPPNVRTYFELPRPQYRELIRGARVFVVPLYATRWARALGQIAAFEAVAAHVPVIAARTFQLADYFCGEQEILLYEPEDAADLQRQIERLMNNVELGRTLAKNAYARMVREYTEEKYAEALLEVMGDG